MRLSHRKNAKRINEPVAEASTMKKLGGGWYEVNGQKVQGKARAEKLANG